ncbi:MAG: hypothetical protein ACI4QD_00500 [Kiritimatiellia bacterium]
MRTKWLTALVALSIGMASAASDIRVAILRGRGECDADFDGALAACNIVPERFACSAEGMKAFAAKLGALDLVLVAPLFNYAGAKNILKDGQTDFPAIRAWLENGGVMVVTEANYLNARGWVENLAPETKGLQTSKCTSTQWAVLGQVVNEPPLHPLRSFPNRITEGDSWPHFNEPPDGHPAQILARCSEGRPVTLLFEIGAGALVLTTLRQPATATLENYLAFTRLKRAGLNLKTFTQTPLAVGAGTLQMTLAEEPKEPVALELSIETPTQTQTFTTNFHGTTATLDYRLTARGAATVTLHLTTKHGKRPLFIRTTTLPDLLTLHTANYRGIISTARRLPTVPIRLSFAPDREDLHGATVTLTLTDTAGTLVTNAAATLPATGPLEEATLTLNLPDKLPAGYYPLTATLRKHPLHFTATNSLELLAPRPAQCVIDLDNTLLVNGKPYFPLGIYHTVGDYEAPAQIGFNTVQFWKWELSPDKFGMAKGLHKAAAKGLRCLFESNHRGEGIWKYCAEHYADHPAILMWQVDDEPSETDTEPNRLCHAAWHRYDKHHPTALTSCRPDLFPIQCQAADIFAFDPYGSRNTPFDAVGKTVDWCRLAQAATKGRQPLMLVPHAFPSDPGVLRPVVYAGLVHDVRAIFWYCWKQTSGGKVGVGLHAHPEHQTQISNLIHEVHAMLPGLFSPRRRAFESGPIHGLVTGRPKKWAEHYIILVNTTGEEVEADITIPEAHFRTALPRLFVPRVPALGKDGKQKLDRKGNPVFEPPWEKLAGPGRIKRRFKPWETVVYGW